MIKVLSIFGTRPEAIKMAHLVKRLSEHPRIESRVCVTGQHREMLEQVLSLFSIRPDYDLAIMRTNQTLAGISASILERLPSVLKDFQPDCVLVHGDTTTSFCAALSAFYEHVPVGHVEAGLRTGNLMSPWPEEANRHLTGVIASLHFAPTERAKENLLAEGVDSESVLVTGNTVIDTLLEAIKTLDSNAVLAQKMDLEFSALLGTSRLVLITGHRRENFGSGFERICTAIRSLAFRFTDTEFVYPVHLNPIVRERVIGLLNNVPNIHLVEPLQYFEFVYLMKRAALIMTDSGGIQEEAPSLGKPVVVLRDTTERPEAVRAGTAVLAGTDDRRIVAVVSELLEKDEAEIRTRSVNPYGDGRASERIVDALLERFQK